MYPWLRREDRRGRIAFGEVVEVHEAWDSPAPQKSWTVSAMISVMYRLMLSRSSIVAGSQPTFDVNLRPLLHVFIHDIRGIAPRHHMMPLRYLLYGFVCLSV